jgi:23S rRNA (guanosine2251-2'-O)-methyltransferase
MELIFGRRPVIEALGGRRQVFRIYLASGAERSETVRRILEGARSKKVPVVTLSRDELDAKAANATHQGILADVADFQYAELPDLLRKVESKTNSLVVALDQVTDPQNFGAVIRTAAAAGADAILVGKRRTAPITPAAVKASAGLTESAMIVSANLGTALTELKEAGFWVVGADSRGKELVWDLDLKGKIVVTLGSEGRGLSRLVAERCDWLASLPLAPGVDSLNVSAAAAAIIYEVVRQRQSATKA